MGLASVVNQIGIYFGGTYDAGNHRYGTPQVAGLGAVRRGRPKRLDAAEYYLGQSQGTASGSVMFVGRAGEGSDRRVAFGGPTSGVKRIAHPIQLVVWVRSTALYAEDCEDYTIGLRDAITDRIHADRELGSGGWSNGGFQVGEGASPWIRWRLSDVATQEDVQHQTLTVSFDAVEMIFA